MDLPAYIKKIGDAKAAKLFGVKKRTVAAWRRRERFPRPEMLNKVIKAAKGELSHESVCKGAPSEARP